jgi:hypothetical protein
VCDYGRGMDWILDLLTTCIHRSELHFTDHWHRLVSSVYHSLHEPFPGNGFYRGRFFNFPRSGPLVIAARAELFVSWQINWLGPRLAVISHQPPSLLFTGWLSTELSLTNELLHVTSLHWTADNFLNWLLLTTFRHQLIRKHRFHCCSPTTPRPLRRNRCLFVCSNGSISHNNDHHHDMLVWSKN